MSQQQQRQQRQQNNHQTLANKMFAHPSSCLQLFTLALFLILTLNSYRIVECQVDESFYERPGVLASEILRARGYFAEEKYFTTTDGYVIRLTHGSNPLIRNATKLPILFVHGILESDNVFVINSFNARPRDWSNESLANDPNGALAERLASDPSAKALPLLAMNLGHEVWIMSRRGFPGSQQLVGDPTSIPASEADERRQSAAMTNPLSRGLFDNSLLGPFTSALGALFDYGTIAQQVPFSFDQKFWNFSFDPQARYDFPQAINFVLKESNVAKLSVVSHSAGGAISLMALSLYPKLANKIASSVFWSQGFSLGHGDVFNDLTALQPFLENYIGSVPPAFSTTEIQAIAGLFCTTALAQSTLCEGVADLFLGPSAGMEPIRPEFINSLLYPTASHEIAQNLQIVPFGQMREYNYGPFYNLSAIQLETMSFYVGATDTIVSPADVRATLPFLRVPYKFRMIDTAFNHNGYFYHNQNAKLIIIPSLKDIHQNSLNSSNSSGSK